MGDLGTFWLISPKLHRLETSKIFQKPYLVPYLKNDYVCNMVGFAMDGHIFLAKKDYKSETAAGS